MTVMKKIKRDNIILFKTLIFLMISNALIFYFFPEAENFHKIIVSVSVLVLLICIIFFYDNSGSDYN